MEPKYTPYSTRNRVEYEELHPLINYVERVLGWDVSFWTTDDDNWMISTGDHKGVILCSSGVCNIHMNGKQLNVSMDKEVLFEVYLSILPVIRDKSK